MGEPPAKAAPLVLCPLAKLAPLARLDKQSIIVSMPCDRVQASEEAVRKSRPVVTTMGMGGVTTIRRHDVASSLAEQQK
jgi:hypothetical protein